MDPNDIQILQMHEEAFHRWVAFDELLETGQSGLVHCPNHCPNHRLKRVRLLKVPKDRPCGCPERCPYVCPPFLILLNCDPDSIDEIVRLFSSLSLLN